MARGALAFFIALVSIPAHAEPDPDDGLDRSVDALGAPESEGFLVDGRLDGPWVSWYPNGYIREIGAYRDGREHGTWLTYDDDGRLSARGQWAFGRPEGWWYFFHPSGVPASSGMYVDGQRQGDWVERFADGQVFRVTRWVDGESQVDAAAQWCRDFGLEWQVDLGARVEGCVDDEGRRVGLWRGYHANGRVAWERTWAAGLLDEEAFDYHPDGSLLHEGHYRVGAPDGLHVWTAADGGVLGAYTFAGGSGAWRAFHPNGAIAEEGAWAAYRQDGLWRTFGTDGAPESEVVWARGRRVSARLWQYGLLVEGGYENGLRSGLWSAWRADGMRVWSGAYEAGDRVGPWWIGRAQVTFEADEPEVIVRHWPSGRFRELRSRDEWTAYWPEGELLEHAVLVDGLRSPPPDDDDPDTWSRALEIQAWLLADPQPTRSELDATLTPADERAEPRETLATFPEPVARDVTSAEGDYDADGVPDGIWMWFHDSGAKKEQGRLAHGARVGQWRGWDREGRLSWEGDYAADALEGEWKTYRADGSLLLSGHYHEGSRTGPWVWRHSDGSVQTLGDYVHDQPDGLWHGYHDNRQPAWLGRYKRGQRDGHWTFWHPNGGLAMTIDYVDGRALR